MIVETIQKKRYDEIDIAKGIGILLVISGHCFPDVSTASGISIPAFRLLHDVIYSFHMPLMFLLAGFLSQKVLRLDGIGSRMGYIKDRFLRLMIPYFAIGLVYMPMKLVLSKYANRPYDIRTFWQILVGDNPDGGLWYLWALFVAQTVLAVFVSRKNLPFLLPISAAVSLAIGIYGFPFYWFDYAIYYMFFVLLGIAIGTVYEDFAKRVSPIVVILMLAAFCGSVFLTVGKGITVLRFFCGICGSFLVLWISGKLFFGAKDSLACRMLKYFGRYSMDFYVLHGIVMAAVRITLWSILKLNYYVCTICMLLGGLLIPILISKYILRRSRALTFLFLGERTNNKA